jgi:hypothetical protein
MRFRLVVAPAIERECCSSVGCLLQVHVQLHTDRFKGCGRSSRKTQWVASSIVRQCRILNFSLTYKKLKRNHLAVRHEGFEDLEQADLNNGIAAISIVVRIGASAG